MHLWTCTCSPLRCCRYLAIRSVPLRRDGCIGRNPAPFYWHCSYPGCHEACAAPAMLSPPHAAPPCRGTVVPPAAPVLRDRLRERIIQERWVPTLVSRQELPRNLDVSQAHVRAVPSPALCPRLPSLPSSPLPFTPKGGRLGASLLPQQQLFPHSDVPQAYMPCTSPPLFSRRVTVTTAMPPKYSLCIWLAAAHSSSTASSLLVALAVPGFTHVLRF